MLVLLFTSVEQVRGVVFRLRPEQLGDALRRCLVVDPAGQNGGGRHLLRLGQAVIGFRLLPAALWQANSILHGLAAAAGLRDATGGVGLRFTVIYVPEIN